MPCMGCAKLIVQGGIKAIVFAEQYDPDGKAQAVFEKNGIDVENYESQEIRRFISPRELERLRCHGLHSTSLCDGKRMDNPMEVNEAPLDPTQHRSTDASSDVRFLSTSKEQVAQQ
eukprot:GHVQ01033198.1.p2 GENE.GHVQ01033198.1~~GHVQ01033198.1.p2  ORF type:complete len:116 (-),score=9.85 GHVQ01033198.1:98-445(-)